MQQADGDQETIVSFFPVKALSVNGYVIARHPPLRNCHTTLFLSDNSFWDRFLLLQLGTVRKSGAHLP